MKKNFMKKIAALITAASMAASLGTAAFAANFDGTGIKINVDGVNVSPAGEEGVYSVKVDYTVSDGVTNDIGVTMLAYAGSGLSVDTVDYTKYDDKSMQIVGIDQQEQKAQTGSFEFKVTTNNNNGAIKVTAGEPSIVMVSGDNVTPAAAMFTITEPAWVADKAEYTGITEFDVEWPYDEAAIKQAIVKNVSINDIKLSKSGTGKETQFSSIGTVTEESFAVVKAGDTYSVTFTFPSDAVVDGAELDSTLTSVSIGEIVVNKKAWTVTSTSYGSDNKMTISSQGSLAAVKSAVETNLAEVGVTVKGSEEGMTKTIKTVTVGDFTVAGGAAYDETCAADQIVTGSVTADITNDPDVMVNEGNETVLTFGLEVTVRSATAVKWEIESATMSGDPIVFNDQEKGVTADDLLDAVTTEIKRRTITFVGANDGETETVPLTGAAVDVKDAAKFTYKVTVPASAAGLANIPESGYPFDVEVTVNYVKPAGTYGDLNGDDKINAADVAQLWKKVKDSSYVFHDKDDNSVIDDTYAKLTKDDKINASDVAQLWKKVKDSTYVFPVEAE